MKVKLTPPSPKIGDIKPQQGVGATKLLQNCPPADLTQPPQCDTLHITMPGITIDNVYETTEAARLIGIGYATLYRWIKSGKLIAVKLAGRTLIPKSEVERLVNAKQGGIAKCE